MLCSPIESSRFYDKVSAAVLIEDWEDILDKERKWDRVEEGTRAMMTSFLQMEHPGGNQAYQLPDFLPDSVEPSVFLGHQQSCYLL